MGHKHSKPAEHAQDAWVEERFVKFVRESELDADSIIHPWNRILLKFPILRKSFSVVREVFERAVARQHDSTHQEHHQPAQAHTHRHHRSWSIPYEELPATFGDLLARVRNPITGEMLARESAVASAAEIEAVFGPRSLYASSGAGSAAEAHILYRQWLSCVALAFLVGAYRYEHEDSGTHAAAASAGPLVVPVTEDSKALTSIGSFMTHAGLSSIRAPDQTSAEAQSAAAASGLGEEADGGNASPTLLLAAALERAASRHSMQDVLGSSPADAIKRHASNSSLGGHVVQPRGVLGVTATSLLANGTEGGPGAEEGHAPSSIARSESERARVCFPASQAIALEGDSDTAAQVARAAADELHRATIAAEASGAGAGVGSLSPMRVDSASAGGSPGIQTLTSHKSILKRKSLTGMSPTNSGMGSSPEADQLQAQPLSQPAAAASGHITFSSAVPSSSSSGGVADMHDAVPATGMSTSALQRSAGQNSPTTAVARRLARVSSASVELYAGHGTSTAALSYAFHMALEAFIQLDVRRTGTLHRDDLQEAMATTLLMSPSRQSTPHLRSHASASMHEHAAKPSAIPQSALDFLSKERFDELDWNAHGEIRFPDFLLAFSHWTGLDDEEEDEEEETDSKEGEGSSSSSKQRSGLLARLSRGSMNSANSGTAAMET